MATEALISAPITNANATPRVKNNSGVEGGILRQACAFLECTAKDAASTYRMVRIPSNATGISVIFATDDQGTTGDTDIGIYQTNENGGAVVDADFFASAQDLFTAALTDSPVQHESAVYGKEDVEKSIWEALGLSADPDIMYDVVLTLTAAADAGGTVSMKAKYAI